MDDVDNGDRVSTLKGREGGTSLDLLETLKRLPRSKRCIYDHDAMLCAIVAESMLLGIAGIWV